MIKSIDLRLTIDTEAEDVKNAKVIEDGELVTVYWVYDGGGMDVEQILAIVREELAKRFK